MGAIEPLTAPSVWPPTVRFFVLFSLQVTADDLSGRSSAMGLFRDERGESIMEVIGYLAVAGALAAVAWYFVVDAKERKLTPAEQAYVVAVTTQRADAYIQAVATAQASAPPPASQIEPPAPVIASQPPAPPPAQLAPTAAPPPYVPPPAPTSVPPPPPPPPRTKPPMATCVGYMSGLTSTGIDACQEVNADPNLDVAVRGCIGDILNGTAATRSGQLDCINASLHAGDSNLADCFMGLSDQSHFGRVSCRLYFQSF